jgi:hypothetical protein
MATSGGPAEAFVALRAVSPGLGYCGSRRRVRGVVVLAFSQLRPEAGDLVQGWFGSPPAGPPTLERLGKFGSGPPEAPSVPRECSSWRQRFAIAMPLGRWKTQISSLFWRRRSLSATKPRNYTASQRRANFHRAGQQYHPVSRAHSSIAGQSSRVMARRRRWHNRCVGCQLLGSGVKYRSSALVRLNGF